VSFRESSAMDTKNTSLSLRLFVSLRNTIWRMATHCLMFKLEILLLCMLIFLAVVKKMTLLHRPIVRTIAPNFSRSVYQDGERADPLYTVRTVAQNFSCSVYQDGERTDK
jgi:hypothetical protein